MKKTYLKDFPSLGLYFDCFGHKQIDIDYVNFTLTSFDSVKASEKYILQTLHNIIRWAKNERFNKKALIRRQTEFLEFIKLGGICGCSLSERLKKIYKELKKKC